MIEVVSTCILRVRCLDCRRNSFYQKHMRLRIHSQQEMNHPPQTTNKKKTLNLHPNQIRNNKKVLASGGGGRGYQGASWGYSCPGWSGPRVLDGGLVPGVYPLSPGRIWDRSLDRTTDRTRECPPPPTPLLLKGPGTCDHEAPPDVNRHDTFKNIFSRHTSYASGNNTIHHGVKNFTLVTHWVLNHLHWFSQPTLLPPYLP